MSEFDLSFVVELNGMEHSVIPIREALTSSDGLVIFAENSAYGHISDDGKKVDAVTVASFYKTGGLEQIGFVKVGVEGYEPDVFKGLERLPKKPLVYSSTTHSAY